MTATEGEGTWWVHTHGAARFDVPDLELYGLARAQTAAATAQRGWKAQPVGRAAGFGGSPFSTMRPPRRPRWGMAETSACA